MKKVSAREIKNVVGGLCKGETVFINALGLTDKAIDALRSYIECGELQPEAEQLHALIVPQAWCKYISGECIAPQMEYVKM